MKYPLTHPQQNVYMTEQFFGRTSVSNIGGYIMMTDKVDVQIVKNAIHRVIADNDGLRMRIVDDNENVYQIISNADRNMIPNISVSTPEKLDKYVFEQMALPFDMSGNLYDFRVIELPNNTAFMIKLHHYVADSWAISSVVNQILAHIENSDVDSFSASYVDFIESDSSYIESKRYFKDKAYWEEKYKDKPSYVSLYLSDSDQYDISAGRNSYSLNQSITSEIKSYCDKHSISPAVFFEAIVSLYAMRINNSDDITLCTISANRSGAKEKTTVGMFNNIVPMTVHCNWNDSFIDFCSAMMSEHFSLLKHSKYPLADIMATVKNNHGKDTALYDIMVSYQSDSINNIGNHKAVWTFNGCCELGFMMNIDDRTGSGEYHINIDYQLKKFNKQDIDSIWVRLEYVVCQVLNSDDILFKDVEIVTAEEKKKILFDFNQENIAYPTDICVHQIFEAQAKKYPTCIAVTYAGEEITYDELNNKANAFAYELHEHGVTKETIVAVALDKSINTIIATLGILKAGGAYLPIDPSFPLERIEFMLSDSGTEFLVSTPEFFAKIDFDGVKLEIPECYDDHYTNLPCVNTQNDLLYIIYTSGSTGIPKGALIEHKNVVRLFFNDNTLYDFSEHDVWTMFHSYCFDFSVWEMYGALLYGGRLVIVPKSTARDTDAFLELIKKENVTVLNQTPAAFYNLIECEAKHDRENLSLRYVIFGGEALKPSLLQPFHSRHPKVSLINMYGITETTVHVTYKDLSDDDILLENSNIGKPIPTLTTYIMDKELGLLPFGVPGEICVGGAGVCRGYLNRPELTNQKFVIDPKLNIKLYRSGDSAILTENGNMEYMGRIDNQVKIRGFRVELGEIEKKILSYKRIKNVVVTVYKYNGDDLLCAYIVPEAHIDISLLKGYLHTLLPDYMIPVCFMQLNKLPLTSNGKVDRKSLPNPVIDHEDIVYVAPENEIEKKFEKIFCELLRVDKISVEADLFNYGASSFTVVRFLAKIYSENYQITTADVYRYKTIRSLAELVIKDTVHKTQMCDNLLIETVPAYDETDAVNSKEYKTIMLTGATGFLGAHILYKLMTETRSDVICIVRGKDNSSAEKRLYDNLTYYFSNDFADQFAGRIKVLCGDICEENFALSEASVTYLSNHVKLLIHAAALVKYFGTEEEFNQINVSGTQNALNLAKMLNARYAHISTVGISGSYLTKSEVKGTIINEKSFYVGQNFTDNLYVKTKFEAENLVLHEMNQGMDATICRMGNLIGRWSDGHFQININENAFYNILRSVIGLGCISDSMLDVDVELTPVDLAAEAVVRIIGTEESSQRVFHIANPHEPKFSVLVSYLSKMGIHIDSMSDPAFYESLQKMTQDETKSDLVNGIMIDMDDTKKLDYNIDVSVDTRITQAYLKMCNFEWAVPTFEYLLKIIQHIREQKLL